MRYFRLAIIAFLLAGCVRASSTQPINVPEPSPTPGIVTPQGTPQVQATAAQKQTITPETLPATRVPSPTPAVVGTLGNQVMQTLLDFPLVTGNSWVYRYEGYSGQQTAAWRVADTIVQEETHSPFYAVKIQSEVTLLEGTPGSDFINPPQSLIFWYAVDGSSIYRLEDPINWAGLGSSWLEFLFPFPGETYWYPDPTQRAQSPAAGLPGCRSASGPVTVDTPTGHFDNCYQVTTLYNSGDTILTFCRGLGIVEGEYHHNGTEYGYHYALTAYLLQ
jgi:hypothetical protein